MLLTFHLKIEFQKISLYAMGTQAQSPEPASLHSTMAMAERPRLPNELFRQIVDVVQVKDLISLCLASRALSYEAYRVLYRRMDIRKEPTLRLALRTFKESPELISLVHTLILLLLVYTDSASIEQCSSDFVATVNAMENLRVLHIAQTWQTINGRVEYIWINGLKLPRIKTLSIGSFNQGCLTCNFAQLPSPLTTLIVRQPRCLGHYVGVQRLRSLERLRMEPSNKILDNLQVLELQFPFNLPNTDSWAPNLHTITYFGDLLHYRRYSAGVWLRGISIPLSVRRVGPIFCPGIIGVWFCHIPAQSLTSNSSP
jgi:hypothetical protein